MSRQVSRRAALGASLPWAFVLAGCTHSGGGAEGAAGSSAPGASARGGRPSDTTDSPLTARVRGTQIRIDGTAPAGRRRHYLDHAVDAVVPVDRVWGKDSLPARVRLTAPATASEFARLTGATRDDVPAITRPDGRVIIHPDLWHRTTAPGRQIVLTHELTHVALDQGRWKHAPRWVVEGPAELTAYRGSRLTPARIAPGVARLVRADHEPEGPPSEQDMTGKDGYGLAWAWCRYLVARDGEAAVVRFVRRVGRTPTAAGTRTAFRQTYGASPERVASGYPTWLASWV